MRFFATFAISVRTFAFAAVFGGVAASSYASDAVVKYHHGAADRQAFAVALRSPQVAETSIERHLIFVDTSATQVGVVRDSSLKLVREVVAELGTDHVQILAIDVDCQPLTDGFVAADSIAANDALERLDLRTPLGATDIVAALKYAVRNASDQQATSLLYIGDGFSHNRISQDQLQTLITSLVQRNVHLHAQLLGPKTNENLPGILANLTGGTAAVVQRGVEAEAANSLATALRTQPTRATGLTINGEKLEVRPSAFFLRPDRHTVVFSNAAINGDVNSLSCTLIDSEKRTRDARWTNIQSSAGGAELLHLAAAAVQSNGLNAPVCDLDSLNRAANKFETAMKQTVRSAKQLIKSGRPLQAKQVLVNASEMDQTNQEVKILLTSLQPPAGPAGTFQEYGDATNAVLDVDDPAAPDPLLDAAARIRLQSQILTAETNAAIDAANLRSVDDPEYATATLKGVLETIQSSPDISPDIRAELERRVIAAIGDIRSRVEVLTLRQKQIARDEAVREAQKLLLEEELLLEARLETQIERIRGLLDRGRHGDIDAFEEAEAQSRITLDDKPGSGTATQALVMSEALGQLDKAYRLVNLRHDRFLEVLYQVELSHVPFPDEPPILYPAADVWRALTLVRKPRYESSDLRSEAPVETWLRQMLDKPVRNLNFPGDTPLSEILDTIATYFTATYGAGVGASGTDFRMTIYPDQGELDLESITLDDVTITDIDFDGMSLRNALKLIFEQTESDQKSAVPLTYVIEDEVMKITTVDKAQSSSSAVTRVYPVADLVIPPSAAQQLGGGGLGGGGGGLGGGGLGGGGLGGGGLGGGGQFGGGGGGQFGGGGGFMSLPPEPVGADIDSSDLNGLKKKP
ncbi:MAG: hypothetical protein Fues2KO_01660 [Fuerstiella sp.]